MARKLGRPRAGAETITQEQILATALRLVDEQGVNALTMRRLAAALDVDPMTIYRHLPDKAALMAGLVARVFGEFHMPDLPGASWQERVRAFAETYRALARAHPHLLVYTITHPEAASRAVLGEVEQLFALFEQAGLAPHAALLAADVLMDYLNGYALADSTGRIGQPGERRELLAELAELPPDRYPALRRVYGALGEDAEVSNFEAGVELILAGIETLL